MTYALIGETTNIVLSMSLSVLHSCLLYVCKVVSTCPVFVCFNILFFFFNDTAPPKIYPLPLHDALPISGGVCPSSSLKRAANAERDMPAASARDSTVQGVFTLSSSEEHTSELQSP